MSRQIKTILIANRGEIAVRVMRTCREMNIRSVAIFSECDATAYHVRMADEAFLIGPSPSSESYLVHDRLIEAAKASGADAIHPGYGFVAENAEFAERCAREGIVFIGPKPQTIRDLGDKLLAREMAVKGGLPVVAGADIGNDDPKTALKKAREIGFPILVKAAAGGGGKGMRVVNDEDGLAEALSLASDEARKAFGDERVFIEQYLTRPRHIEIQIMCDEHGHAVHLGERECSIQR
ncbi:MAG: biotin carboxylase N-terminal domain-containing protein, partial [candidate division Zixibacteria bacterium]